MMGSPPSKSRPTLSQSPGNDYLPTKTLLSVLLLSMIWHDVGHLFAQLQPAVPAVSPHTVLCTPRLLHWSSRGGKLKPWLLSNSQNTGGLSICHLSHRCKGLLWRKQSPFQPDPLHSAKAWWKAIWNLLTDTYIAQVASFTGNWKSALKRAFPPDCVPDSWRRSCP